MGIFRDQKSFFGDKEALDIILKTIRYKDKTIWNNWRNKRKKEKIDLSGVNLHYAFLREIDFYNTLFDEADLHEAKLVAANLIFSEIRNTNLFNADLRGAKLVKCKIINSNLTGVKLFGTTIDGWELLNIKCEYIYKGDQGITKIPEKNYFLPSQFEELFSKNQSIPEIIEREYLLGRQLNHVFISYVHEDKDKVLKLCDELEKNNIKVWVDRKRLQPGVKWQTAIRNAIQHGTYFLACFSNNTANKERSYMYKELRIALNQLQKMPFDRVWFIPVKLDDCKIPDIEFGPSEYLSDIQYIDLSEVETWDKNVKKLIRQFLHTG